MRDQPRGTDSHTCHCQYARTAELQLRVDLVRERLAPDGAATAASRSRITGLQDEGLDDAVDLLYNISVSSDVR